MSTITLAQQFEVQVCCEVGCGIAFAITTDMYRDLLDHRGPHGRHFYCPNGHDQWFVGKTETERLREQLANMERAKDRWITAHDQVAKEQAHTARQLAAAKGRITKMQNRIRAGVCPVPGCKRSGLGADVVAHIATVHPDWHDHEPAVS